MDLTCALVSHIYMWAISKNILSDELIVEILHRADYLISSDDLEKHVFFDKDFFSSNGDESNNLNILNKIHETVWSKISEFLPYHEPVVDHAVLLFKNQELARLNGIKIAHIGPQEIRMLQYFRVDRCRRYYGR